MAILGRVAAVTGANKGIGLAIGVYSDPRPTNSPADTFPNHTVRNLALTYPTSPLRSGPLLIYLTARSAKRGAEAVKTLQNDLQLKNARVLAADGGDTTIKFAELDISQPQSIQHFTEFLRKENPEGIDFFINNAGGSFIRFPSLEAELGGLALI